MVFITMLAKLSFFKNFNSVSIFNFLILFNLYAYYTYTFYILDVFKKHKYIRLFLKRGKRKPFWKLKRKFKFFKRMKFKRFKRKLLITFPFKKNLILNVFSQKNILFLKRSFGLFKYRFDKKKYTLYRMKYILDKVRKKRIKPRNFSFRPFKKRYFSRLFYNPLRSTLMLTTNNKANRQFKQTKIVSKITKKDNWINSLVSDTFIWKILVKCKFFFNRKKAIFFIVNAGVYINGELEKNPYRVVEAGDTIQIARTYFFSKIFFKRFKRLRRFVRRIRSRVFRLMRHKINPNKQATKNVPSWILRFENFKSYRSVHVQSDYLTYSFIVIYRPMHILNYIDKFYMPNTAYLLRLYNWRYAV